MTDYIDMATKADLLTESCLSKMSKGALGVFKDTLYPIVFKTIFEDMIKKQRITEAKENETETENISNTYCEN